MIARNIPVGFTGKSVLVWWDKGNPYLTDQINLQLMGPRQGVLAAWKLFPQEARKIARALLRAANELEGRPPLRLVKSGRRSR